MTTPAAHTRNEAIVSGGKERKPIFAAIKLTAQIVTIIPIRRAMTGRLGARPLEDWTSTASDQPFFPHREFFDQVAARLETDARPRWHANRALCRHCHFRLDNILMPVAPAGSNVSRQGEIGKCRKRDVVCAPDTGLKHASAPHRHSILLAQIVDAL